MAWRPISPAKPQQKPLPHGYPLLRRDPSKVIRERQLYKTLVSGGGGGRTEHL